ncbi:MAG: fucose isomerase, partial [Caldilinea sp.]|nr:fucose isomerase [Caldilinea sp.]
MKLATKPVTLGLIVGNRDFFPAHLCDSGRTTVLKVLEAEGFKVVALSPEESRYGSIESLEEA